MFAISHNKGSLSSKFFPTGLLPCDAIKSFTKASHVTKYRPFIGPLACGSFQFRSNPNDQATFEINYWTPAVSLNKLCINFYLVGTNSCHFPFQLRDHRSSLAITIACHIITYIDGLTTGVWFEHRLIAYNGEINQVTAGGDKYTGSINFYLFTIRFSKAERFLARNHMRIGDADRFALDFTNKPGSDTLIAFYYKQSVSVGPEIACRILRLGRLSRHWPGNLSQKADA